MTDQMPPRLRPSLADTRIDLVVFVLSFLAGLVAYLVLHLTGQAQWTTTTVLVLLMIVYAVVASRVPKLRIRLDQAGDNAYYLGLLFTLVSMAVALYEFGNSIDATGAESSSAQKIIGNFGVALASTITGIFLRLLLHQMRVDPADVEGMTRIELADASQKVRAKLESVSIDMGRFHDELLQRSGDLQSKLVEESGRTMTALSVEANAAAARIVSEAANAQHEIARQTAATIAILQTLTPAVRVLVDRLSSAELPPTRFATRLEKTVGSFERLDAALASIEPTLSALRDSMQSSLDGAANTHKELLKQLSASATVMNASLESVGRTLSADRQLLEGIEKQAEESAANARLAQDASADVLRRLIGATESMTQLLSEKSASTDQTN